MLTSPSWSAAVVAAAVVDAAGAFVVVAAALIGLGGVLLVRCAPAGACTLPRAIANLHISAGRLSLCSRAATQSDRSRREGRHGGRTNIVLRWRDARPLLLSTYVQLNANKWGINVFVEKI